MGYQQIPVRAEDRPKTAFITHKGLYLFTAMPFGQGYAPGTFQRLMACIFRQQIGKDLPAYLDDLHLGHIIKEVKIAADRSKLDKIREWPFPTSGNEMASFLGLYNYYRCLIPHFAEYAEPIYKQVLELKVTAAAVLETAFAKLKDELCDGVALKLPNPDKPFVMDTYASIHAVGAVLLQSEGKSSTPRSFTVKHSMLLKAITPPTNVNCWQS